MGWNRKLRLLACLITGAVVAVGLLCLWGGARRVGRPFPGFLLAYNGIVVSIGRADWSAQLDEKIPFSQVLSVEGSTAGSADEIQAYVETLPVGTPVTYRLRKGSEVFAATVPTRLFDDSDFLSLYVNYFVVGLVFALAGLWALWGAARGQPATPSFFALSQSCAVVLLTAGDVYGPYRFTPLYFTAHCLTPAFALHFASAFPERFGGRASRAIALTALYGASAALALALNVVANSPSLFLPLVYTVYLLLANAILLYLGRLLISRSSVVDSSRRRAVDVAIAGVLLALLVPAGIFVVYPVLKGLISPLLIVAPLAFFPLFTAAAVRRAAQGAVAPGIGSVRLRLSFLFLAAVETAFLAGIAYFWLSNSWQQLFDDVALFHAQEARVQQLHLDDAEVAADLERIEAYVQGSGNRALVHTARQALARGDQGVAQRVLDELRVRYHALGERLDERRRWLGRMDAALVVILVLLGMAQAVAFTVAVRRWLIRPIDQLSEATQVIATGDLGYRTRLESSQEFASLAQSINTMAASLDAIQKRVDAERTARERAAAVATDAERRRLARELHDSILQDLSAVKLAVEGEARKTREGPMQIVADNVIRVIVGLRRVVDDLRPQDLSHVSLGDAIATYARSLAQRHGVEIELDLEHADEVADWAARDVYRIAQEAVGNAVRHGAPHRIQVRLYRRGADMALEVSDDGSGFDPASAVRGGGLAGMSERAASLGAQLHLGSRPGGGTILSLVIPPSQVPGAQSPL